MKKLLLILPLLVLASCNEQLVDQRQQIQSQLPSDCQFFDLGTYGRIDALVMIRCDGSQTTTQGYDKRHKQSSREFSLTTHG